MEKKMTEKNGIQEEMTQKTKITPDSPEDAEQVSKGSEDVAGASQSLAEGATEQTDALKELNGTVEDISDKIQQNAKQATEVRDIVTEMNNDIQQSNIHMNNMTVAMGRIADASKEIVEITEKE